MGCRTQRTDCTYYFGCVHFIKIRLQRFVKIVLEVPDNLLLGKVDGGLDRSVAVLWKLPRLWTKTIENAEEMSGIVLGKARWIHYKENREQCDQRKIAKCPKKLPKNDFTRKMVDFGTYTKIV